jgi:hypothetical protein
MIRKAILMISLMLAAATFAYADYTALVIPAAGSGPGANASVWRSEVTFHNAGDDSITINVLMYGPDGSLGNNAVLIRPHKSATASDIIKNELLKDNVFGALVLKTISETDASKLAVTSRAINDSPTGQYGQDIPVLPPSEAFRAGDIVVVNGPQKPEENRFNFGLFPMENTTIEWTLRRKEGEVAAQKTVTYDALKHVQYNGGVSTFFGLTPEANDAVIATVKSGRVFVYGSMVNTLSGDPSFVPGIATRNNVAPLFLGVDLDEDGFIDVADANADYVLDQPIVVFAGTFPNFFRVLAEDPEGHTLQYEIVGGSSDVKIVSGQPAATIQWLPAQELRGTSGTLTIRVTDGVDSTDFTIPVLFR